MFLHSCSRPALVTSQLIIRSYDFRFEFQSHCGRLNTQLEYNQSRLEQEKKKCGKIEENVEKEERTADELKKV